MNNTHKYTYLLHDQTTAIADPAADIGWGKKAQTILKADLWCSVLILPHSATACIKLSAGIFTLWSTVLTSRWHRGEGDALRQPHQVVPLHSYKRKSTHEHTPCTAAVEEWAEVKLQKILCLGYTFHLHFSTDFNKNINRYKHGKDLTV